MTYESNRAPHTLPLQNRAQLSARRVTWWNGPYNHLENCFTSRLVLSVAAVSLQGDTCSPGAGSHAYSPTDDLASGAIWGSGASFRDISANAVRAGHQPASIIIQPQMCFMFLFQRISFSFSSGLLTGGHEELIWEDRQLAWFSSCCSGASVNI